MVNLHASIRDIPMPPRMAALPLTERGFPALYFAAKIDGRVDLRVADGDKWRRCVKQNRCWLCGETLGVWKCWPIGPMCVINRVSSEPPSHAECAEYAVKACPFLTRPHAKRNEKGIEDLQENVAGIMLARNPGVSALWYAKQYQPFKAGNAG